MTTEDVLKALEDPAEATTRIRGERSKREFARVSGLNRSTLQGIENGRHEPLVSTMLKILRAA